MALSTLYGVCISIKPTQLKLNVNTQNLTIKMKKLFHNFYFLSFETNLNVFLCCL